MIFIQCTLFARADAKRRLTKPLTVSQASR